jgi:hypothetical protein
VVQAGTRGFTRRDDALSPNADQLARPPSDKDRCGGRPPGDSRASFVDESSQPDAAVALLRCCYC